MKTTKIGLLSALLSLLIATLPIFAYAETAGYEPVEMDLMNEPQEDAEKTDSAQPENGHIEQEAIQTEEIEASEPAPAVEPEADEQQPEETDAPLGREPEETDQPAGIEESDDATSVGEQPSPAETAAAETEAPEETVAAETEAPAETAVAETEAPAENIAAETEAPEETAVVETETPAEADDEIERSTIAPEAETSDAVGAEEDRTFADTDEETGEADSPDPEELPKDAAESIDGEAPDETVRKVLIFSSRRSVMRAGEKIVLTSRLEGFEDCHEITYQWECDRGAGFTPVEGANGAEWSYELTEESLSWEWRLTVRYRINRPGSER